MGQLFSNNTNTKPFHVDKDGLNAMIKSLQMKQPLVDELDEHKDQARIQWIVKHLLQVHHLLEKERPVQTNYELTTI